MSTVWRKWSIFGTKGNGILYIWFWWSESLFPAVFAFNSTIEISSKIHHIHRHLIGEKEASGPNMCRFVPLWLSDGWMWMTKFVSNRFHLLYQLPKKDRHGRNDTSQRKWGWITCPFVCWRLIINEGSSFARNINIFDPKNVRLAMDVCSQWTVMQVALATGRWVVRVCSRLTQPYFFKICLSIQLYTLFSSVWVKMASVQSTFTYAVFFSIQQWHDGITPRSKVQDAGFVQE